MIEYINGALVELTPTQAVVDVHGIGYAVNITLVTYQELTGKSECKLYVYEAIREDAHLLYGFSTQDERSVFLQLLSVSGVGANTARMIMSSLSAAELQDVIVNENVSALKNVKGIGLKTAQRIVVDLHDKMGKLALEKSAGNAGPRNAMVDDAVSALVVLGLPQAASQKTVEQLLRDNPSMTVAELVKKSLNLLK